MVKSCSHPKLPNELLKEWYVTIRDWILPASVGILPSECEEVQDIRLNIRCRVQAPQPREAPTCEEVVCYDELKQNVSALIESRHFYLMENLAEDIATLCLKDPRVKEVSIQVEKIFSPSQEPIFGVEITRHQNK